MSEFSLGDEIEKWKEKSLVAAGCRGKEEES
jgi:hypothetical protein